MKSSAKKVELASVDDLFTTEQERQEADEERVVRIPLTQLHYFKGYPAMQTEVPFTGQPYRFKDDDPKMQETLDSVKKRGVRAPGLVRPDPDGGYEIISGHRRHRASELAGLEDMPVIIRDMTDEEAVIEMVDANIQREKVMPSEKAWAYRMKLEAIKHQGARTDLTSVQVEQKLSARDKVAKDAGEKSGIQIMRYIRLTELIPELLDMVDEKKIAFNPAYELSFLKKEEQIQLLDAMDSEQATPSLSQAQRLKKFSQEGRLSIDVMRAIMGEEKKSDLDKVTFTSDTLRKYFPKSYTPARMQETITEPRSQTQQEKTAPRRLHILPATVFSPAMRTEPSARMRRSAGPRSPFCCIAVSLRHLWGSMGKNLCLRMFLPGTGPKRTYTARRFWAGYRAVPMGCSTRNAKSPALKLSQPSTGCSDGMNL